MKIKQLGNGGAFDIDETNSSFLIGLENETNDYLLFDCGYNVFEKLRKDPELDKLIKDINYVYISHLDDDHIGSLKTLLYYRYFILGKTTQILANPILPNLCTYLGKINNEFKFNKTVPTKIVEFINQIPNFYTNFIEGTHHLPSYGLVIGQRNNTSLSNLIYISSDTKVNNNTVDAIKYIVSLCSEKEREHLNFYKIFHDYSNWDSYDQQTHTCKYDFEKYYNQFIENGLEINKYHNNAEYNKDWQQLGNYDFDFNESNKIYISKDEISSFNESLF